jgi:hypothetical protein
MTEHDIELARRAGFKEHRDGGLTHCGFYVTDELTKFASLIRDEKQGEANPVACMFINYDGGCEEIGHLDNYNGQVPDEFTPLFTYQPDQGEEITKLKNILRLRRLIFNARESRLRKALKNCAESLKGYRREMNDHQPCDAEKIAIEILENT